MALFTCRYFSEVLGLSTTATVILPQAAAEPSPASAEVTRTRLPVLYLLHGLSDDDSTWLRRTSLERYVAHRRLAVVMPAAHRSFYTDQVEGYPYFTHIADEVPRVMSEFFPLSTRREDTFVAGLSMGGYGAFKLALRRPQRFAAAVSLSGALDIARDPGELGAEWKRTFGKSRRAADAGDDLMTLLQNSDAEDLPRLRAWCGTEDFLLDHNRAFRDECARQGVALDYAESPGDHEWGAWDAQLEAVLDWCTPR